MSRWGAGTVEKNKTHNDDRQHKKTSATCRGTASSLADDGGPANKMMAGNMVSSKAE
jgi:hypothetical protein